MMVEDRGTLESRVSVGRGSPLAGDGMWIRNIVDVPPLLTALISDECGSRASVGNGGTVVIIFGFGRWRANIRRRG